MGVNREEFRDAVSIKSSKVERHIVGGTEKKVEKEISEVTEMDSEEIASDEWKVKKFSDIKKLDIDISIGYLEIEEYDGEELSVYYLKTDERTKLELDERELTIKQKGDVPSIFEDGVECPVKIMVPENWKFEEVDIEVGAGEAVIANIEADEIKGEIGAGSLEITQTAQAKESEWSVGAGSLYLNHLISEKTELECSVGEINATLDGTESDYRMKGSIGVGSLRFGESEWDSVGQKVQSGDDTAKNKVSIDCGTGEITIDFAE